MIGQKRNHEMISGLRLSKDKGTSVPAAKKLQTTATVHADVLVGEQTSESTPVTVLEISTQASGLLKGSERAFLENVVPEGASPSPQYTSIQQSAEGYVLTKEPGITSANVPHDGDYLMIGGQTFPSEGMANKCADFTKLPSASQGDTLCRALSG